LSERRRVEDPTQNRYLADRLVSRFHGAINHVQGTAEANPDNKELLEDLLNWLALMMAEQLLMYVDMSIRRGTFFSINEINRRPEYHVSFSFMERWPSDIELKESLMEENDAYINNVLNDIRAGNYTQAKTRANQIGRTATMEGFNESSRRRYQAFGVKRYRFHAHLNCCNEPKKLRDGSIVQGGCEELHNQTFSIEDTVHRPPIHPLGRCTILPEF